MRGIRIGALLLACALPAAAEPGAAPQRQADFSGTWRLAARQLKMSVQDKHAGRRALPHITMLVTQRPESLTVQRQLFDSTGRPRGSPGRLTFRTGAEWRGPHNSPPGSTATTRVQWREGGRALELTTVAVYPRRGGGDQGRITTTETWRLDAAGVLHRQVREVNPAGTIELTETWRRERR